MKIYTKTGDKGMTSLASGTKVAKYHDRLEAYGTTDELNSIVGWIETQILDPKIRMILDKAQSHIFTISSALAMDKEELQSKLPIIEDHDIDELEKDMDRMMDLLPSVKQFVLPGGHSAVAACHMARTSCRRAERLMVKLSVVVHVEEIHLKYINRFSDYLFVAARKTALDAGVEEKFWHPNSGSKD